MSLKLKFFLAGLGSGLSFGAAVVLISRGVIWYVERS